MKKVFQMAGLAVALLVVMPSVRAEAQSGPGPSGFGGNGQGGEGPGVGRARAFMACREDAQTFCKGIQPGGGRIKDCLEDHYKEISDACYDVLKNAPSGPPRGGGSDNGPPQNGGPPDDGSPSDNRQ